MRYIIIFLKVTLSKKYKAKMENQRDLTSTKDDDGSSFTIHEKIQRGKYAKKPVASGFKEDAIKILRLFADCDNLKFSQFGELWLKHNLVLFYMGKENERELCEAVHEMFGITLSFLTDPELNFNMKVGAIYLLYCLYEKQPYPKYRVKIRITEEEAKIVQQIFDVAKETGLTNCVFVILKLIYNHAFHFVGSRFLMGPESSDYRNCQDKSDPIIHTWNSEFKELWNKGSFKERKALEDEIKILQAELKIEHVFPNFEASSSKLLKIAEAAAKGDESVFAMLNDDDENENHVSIGVRRAEIKQQQLQTNSVPQRYERKYYRCSSPSRDDMDVDDPLSVITFKEKETNEIYKSEIDSIDENNTLYVSDDESGSPYNNPQNKNNDSIPRKKITVRKNYETKKITDNSVEAEIPNKTSPEIDKEDKSEITNSPTKSPSKLKCRMKTSWRKARIIGRSRPEKKVMKGKKIGYYDDSEESDED